MIWRKIKITAEEKQSPEWPYIPQRLLKCQKKNRYLKFTIQFFIPFMENMQLTSTDMQKQNLLS